MEASSALKMLRFAAWIVPAAAIAWTLASGAGRAKGAGGRAPTGALWALAIAAAVVTAVVALCLDAVLGKGDSGVTLWVNIAAGGAIALLGLLVAGHLRRDDPDDGAAQAGSAVAVLALAVLFGAYLISKHTARPDAWLPAGALGAAAFVAFFAIAAGMARQAGHVQSRLVRPLELLAAACAAVALGMLVGKLHYPNIRHAGDAVTLWLAIALLVWLPLSIVRRFSSRESAAVSGVLFALFAVLTAWLGSLAAKVNLLEASASQCFWAGLAAGLAAALMHAAGLFRSAMARQAGAVCLLIVVAASALSMRLLTGFGAAACAAGFLAAIPGWALLSPWNRESAQDAFPGTLLWAPGFLACFAALRIWLEGAGSMNVPAFAPYNFLGLAAGIALPFAVWSLLPWGRPEDERPGPALAIAGAIIALLAIAGTTVGVSVVFREPAVRLFLMGLAASGIAGAIVSWSEQRGWTAAPVTAASLFAALLAVTAAQPLQDFSAEAGRPEKVHALIVISAALIVFYALTEVWRWFAERRGAPPA